MSPSPRATGEVFVTLSTAGSIPGAERKCHTVPCAPWGLATLGSSEITSGSPIVKL